MPPPPATPPPGRTASPTLWFGLAFLVIHIAAWPLIASGRTFWHGFGVACASAFLAGLLAGALRAMNPMDANALGEPLILPSTLPGRQAPILLLGVLFGMVATPIAGLLFYLVFAYAKACIDERVLVIFGLTIVSGLVLSVPSPAPFAAAFRFQSAAMLPSMMTGWALSSLFRSDAWSGR
jgi:hypothetical protein